MRGNAPEADDQIPVFFGLCLCFFQLLRIGYVGLMLHATRLEIAVQRRLEGLFSSVVLEDRCKTVDHDAIVRLDLYEGDFVSRARCSGRHRSASVRDLRFPQARSPNVWFEPWFDLILFMLGKKQLDIGCGEKSANYDDCRAKDRQRA